MSKLIKPAEYAKQSGISRQAVYAKIKKGLLNTRKVDGKIYIELDSSISINHKSDTSKSSSDSKDLIAAKDETIKILKETINDLKKTNHLIVGTLKSEVELLKEAFNEMQKIYRMHIESFNFKVHNQVEYKKTLDENRFIDFKELARELGLDKEDKKRLKRVATKLQKVGDVRFIYIDDELFALKSADYSDFIRILKEDKEELS